MAKTAVIAGSSGLVGSYLLAFLLESNRYEKVIALVRKKTDFQHPKLEQRVTDFSDIASLLIPADDVFCCLGTTIKKAGSKAVFYTVDHDYPLHLANQTHTAGASKFMTISSMGANANSAIFYNRVKGILEKDLEKIGFETLGIFKPSMLLGPRKESRIGESIGKFAMQLFDIIIPNQYKAVEASDVAKSMLVCANSDQKGIIIISNQKIKELALRQLE